MEHINMMPTVFIRFKATLCLVFFRECSKYPNRPVGWQTERSGSWYGLLLRVFAQIIHPIWWKRGPWDVSGCLWEHSESHEERVSHSLKECDATACVKVTGRVGGTRDLHASLHLQLSQLCKWASVWDRPTREEMKLLTVSSIFFSYWRMWKVEFWDLRLSRVCLMGCLSSSSATTDTNKGTKPSLSDWLSDVTYCETSSASVFFPGESHVMKGRVTHRSTLMWTWPAGR